MISFPYGPPRPNRSSIFSLLYLHFFFPRCCFDHTNWQLQQGAKLEPHTPRSLLMVRGSGLSFQFNCAVITERSTGLECSHVVTPAAGGMFRCEQLECVRVRAALNKQQSQWKDFGRPRRS